MTRQSQNKVLPQIINFAAQFKSAHSNGRVQKHFREYLEANRDYIDEVLGEEDEIEKTKIARANAGGLGLLDD